MEIKYLLDTNVVSEPLRPHPNQKVLQKLEQHQQQMAIAAVVWHELLHGMELLEYSQKREKIKYYLEQIVKKTLSILPYHEAAAEWHARERAKLKKRGISTDFVDGQIAAIAKTHGLTLVAHNTKDFARFEHLTVENWFK